MPGNKLDEYEVVSTIGSGSYGTCKKIKRKSDGRVCLIFCFAILRSERMITII